MPTAVLDASLALRWLMPDEHSESADEARALWEAGDVDFIVPHLFWAEVANALIHAARGNRIAIDDAEDAVRLLEDSGLRTVPASPRTHRTALRLAHQYGRSVHDLVYVALAEERGLRFWHGDRKLETALHSSGAGNRHPTRLIE